MSFSPSEYALREALQQPTIGDALRDYIRERRWFGGKSRTIARAEIVDSIAVPANSPLAYLCFVLLSYEDGQADTYLLPLAFADGTQAADLRRETPQAVVANTDDLTGDAVLYDAVYDPAFCQLLLGAIERGEHFAGSEGGLLAEPNTVFAELRGAGELEPRISRAEQSNTSIIYGDRLILKLFRRIVPGLNPDLEIGRYLTEQGQFEQIAPVAGSLLYDRADAEPATLGMLLGYVPNIGDAWSYALGLLETLRGEIERLPKSAAPDSQEAEPLFEPSIRAARQLGRRTAEMHKALGASTENHDFASEAFSREDAEREVAAMNALADRVFVEARGRLDQQPGAVRGDIEAILEHEDAIRKRFTALTARPLTALRTRAHGDYHLGQVLATGEGDFVIIDFEGEPARSLEERRAKRSPLRDVAGMLRSFDYAAASVLVGNARLEQWAHTWVRLVSEAFLESYLDTAHDASFLPKSAEEREALLDAYLIEKAVYELQYELNNRPDWARIPAGGILGLV